MPTEREIEAGAKAVCRKFAKVGSCGRAEEFEGKCERCREYSSIALEAAERERRMQVLTDHGLTNPVQVEHDAEEFECAMLWLDRIGIPREGAKGTFSLVGRIELYGNRDRATHTTAEPVTRKG